MANLRMEETLRVSDIRCKRERPKGPHFIVEEKVAFPAMLIAEIVI